MSGNSITGVVVGWKGLNTLHFAGQLAIQRVIGQENSFCPFNLDPHMNQNEHCG